MKCVLKTSQCGNDGGQRPEASQWANVRWMALLLTLSVELSTPGLAAAADKPPTRARTCWFDFRDFDRNGDIAVVSADLRQVVSYAISEKDGGYLVTLRRRGMPDEQLYLPDGKGLPTPADLRRAMGACRP